MSAILRRFGLYLVVLANRIEQRSRLTLALEPIAAQPAPDHDNALCDLRDRLARYY